MPDKYGLNQKVIDQILKILAQHSKVEKAVLYGSRAKGNYKHGSDIDLTLISPTMSLSELLKIETEIDDLLLPYKVDLSLFHLIDHSDLIEHIQRVGVIFYEK